MTNRARILALDDTRDTLELIALSLGQEFDVLCIADPMQLYEYIELFEPDLLILDIMMPRVSGFQIVEMLRHNEHLKTLPVMILSAKNSPADMKMGYRLGATMYLTKPFQPERLLKNVQAQFHTCPPSDTKKHTMTQVDTQLRMKTGSQEGIVKLSTQMLGEMGGPKKLRDLQKPIRRD